MSETFDILVIGGGVIGIATARALLIRHPELKVALLEKESALAQHTSGHNSGVLHVGYNQKPGTLKAKLCVEGNRLIRDYCARTGVPLIENGILIVARKPSEFEILEELHKRGTANGAPGLQLIDQQELRRREPNVIGEKALWAPSGAAVDSVALALRLAADARSSGAQFFMGRQVRSIEVSANGYHVKTTGGDLFGKRLINCAGLHADRIAHMTGAGKGYTIVPFRGEYFKVRKDLSGLVSAMIYPVPDLNFPFLGIHWTKTACHELKVGPNAILAFGRESYRFWDIHPLDCLDMLTKPGVWRLIRNKDFRRLVREQLRTSLSRQTFLQEACAIVSGVTPDDFVPGSAGIRAQLVSPKGELVDDLLIENQGTALHVLNTISPGFTCSMAFAEYLVDSIRAKKVDHSL